jgi:hypothetical protein
MAIDDRTCRETADKQKAEIGLPIKQYLTIRAVLV